MERTGKLSARVGFIGVGGIATSHLRSLLRMPEAEVVALCDISSEQIERTKQRIERYLKDTGIDAAHKLDATTYTDYHQMLRNEQLDAVYVCLPPFVHGEPEEAIIEAGLPMLVEKPLSLELGTAARLLRSIREKKLIAASGYQYRYTDYLRTAAEKLAGHTIGQVVVTRFGRTPGTPWYHLQNRSGGQLIEMATHQMDVARYLAGEVKTIYAAGATRINNKSNPEYDIFDAQSMTLTFDSGVIGSFDCNFITPHKLPMESWGVHLFCDDMTLSVGADLKVSTADGIEKIPMDSDPMFKEDTGFIQAVSEGRPELVQSSYESGLRTLAVTIAADRSARSGQPVDIPELLAREAPGL